MKLGYELSKLALEDLNSIWEYTAEQWSIEQANKYYKDIFEVVELICINPKVGKSIIEVKEKHRSIIVKSHLIIYKIEKNIIQIDRILHQRMDIDFHLHE